MGIAYHLAMNTPRNEAAASVFSWARQSGGMRARIATGKVVGPALWALPEPLYNVAGLRWNVNRYGRGARWPLTSNRQWVRPA